MCRAFHSDKHSVFRNAKASALGDGMTHFSRPLAGKRVDVCEYPDGGLEIRHGEHTLPYRMFDKIRQVNQAAIIENKHLDAALIMARLMQEQIIG